MFRRRDNRLSLGGSNFGPRRAASFLERHSGRPDARGQYQRRALLNRAGTSPGPTFREEPRGLTHLKGLSSPSTLSSTFCLFSAASALLLSISSFIFLFSSCVKEATNTRYGIQPPGDARLPPRLSYSGYRCSRQRPVFTLNTPPLPLETYKHVSPRTGGS